MEEDIVRDALGRADLLYAILQRLIGTVGAVVEVPGHVEETGFQATPRLLVEGAVPPHRVAHGRTEPLVPQVASGVADHREGVRQQSLQRQLEEGGYQLTTGEVSGGPEDDHHARLGRVWGNRLGVGRFEAGDAGGRLGHRSRSLHGMTTELISEGGDGAVGEPIPPPG